MADDQPATSASRRAFLGATAATAATVATWSAPVILSVDAAAAASGCTTPSFLGFAEVVADGDASATVTRTMTVINVPVTGTGLAHVAIGNVDHIVGQPASSFATPVGWTLLGFYDSDVVTAGTTGVGSTAVFSERVYLWYRQASLSTTYSFDVTLSGGSGFTPQARLVVAAYSDVGTVADDAGEFLMQGSGFIDPLAPPASSMSFIPAITTDAPSTLALAATGAGNVSITNAIVGPTGYTQDVTANLGNGYPPIWLFSRVVPTGAIAATTATVIPGAPNVGLHAAIECG